MSVSEVVKKSFPYLIVLNENCKNKEIRNNILKSKKVLCAITEIVYNILKGNIDLTKKNKRLLRNYKKELLLIARKGRNIQKNKILSDQRGAGILSTILSVGIPIIASLLSRKHDSKR